MRNRALPESEGLLVPHFMPVEQGPYRRALAMGGRRPVAANQTLPAKMRGQVRQHGLQPHITIGNVDEDEAIPTQMSSVLTKRFNREQMDRDRIGGKGI